MDSLDFTEEEIREQLALLGYKNIPKHRLQEFKQDLDDLIRHGEWKNLTSPPPINSSRSPTASSGPSPPAFTKEKVSRRSFEDSQEGFFLQAGHMDRHSQGQDRDRGQRQRLGDSYAQHSVAPRLQLPPGAPNRLQVEPDPDPDDTLHPPLSDSSTSSPEIQDRRFIRRKVFRKHKGQSLVCDESVYSEDSASCLEERLAELHVSSPAQRETENDEVGSHSETQSSGAEGDALSAFESYIRGMTRSRSDGDIRPKPKSFIRPTRNQQTRKKTDPVAKYFQYKQIWEMFKLPGETDRRALRQEIKDQLAYQPPPVSICSLNLFPLRVRLDQNSGPVW
ncbi:hydrolethalus syndrome protein 1 homolog isoform X2 [Xyrichtys novacula]|uniref:Hydrolethalus syndrome protein 1 homolog isoform X2 n=1 Tax=Xyrichtys novacula TaxID=13765 RepID=A0AAV1EZL2_XYRNO|nr:hydrolethalus syndrome protein 1 homolog isoform X2 [Xyrichtys novacula]